MAGVQNQNQDLDIDIAALFASLVRNWVRIVIVAFAAAGLAFLLSSVATRHYQAETRILIETRESIFTRPEQQNDDTAILDEQGVTSQVEVISSTDILTRVARELDLAAIAEFEADGSVSILERLMIIAGMRGDPIELPPEERVLKVFREKLNVYRVEGSRVIVVEFSSEDPRLAAKVPNAIADAYIALQKSAKLQSNADATEWLEPEIADLRAKVKEAEGRVAEFRAQSDLLLGNNNSMLATQQLSELSTELSRVRANRASTEANAASMREALRNGASIDALPDVLSSTLIQRLRENQVQLKADIADLSATLLDNHPRIRALRSQLADLDRQIRSEAEKVLDGMETEAEAARLREKELVSALNQLKAESARVGEQEVELRALEREAAAQRELLESYLSRYREALSRKDRSYLPADARIFSRAIVPGEPYFPKILPITGATLVAVLLLVAVGTLLSELFSGRAMRPTRRFAGEPVQDVVMPQHTPIEPVPTEPTLSEDSSGQDEPQADSVADLDDAMQVPVFTKGQIGIEAAAEKLIATGAARALFVSPEGDEGAASAVMVAREVADAGLRTLLVDLTATAAASYPMLETTRLPGITDLLCSKAQFTDVIHPDHFSDCHVIPAGTADPALAMRAADRLPIIMESLTTAYDLVIVECGPADASGLQRLVGSGTEVLVSVIEENDDAVTTTASELRTGGFENTMLVTPVGYVPPVGPLPGQKSAA
ncbi:chain-length determining protein [Nitratireductor mangrovi]|uniref:Chain-length determining protein n=1 Tax=Nitratireductor mangrovi TaxID=2599600 RepID=A0A5B8KZ24_9HYPH|nr:exopolysaccharide transport family protein [Nitratireductor mangrovi]QDZ00895.1 chain-length determining protein [Nitratireductor mangrovi]